MRNFSVRSIFVKPGEPFALDFDETVVVTDVGSDDVKITILTRHPITLPESAQS